MAAVTSLPVTSATATVKNGCEAIGPVSNFATVKVTADEVVLSNRLSALDQEERLTYRSREIKRVDSSLQIRNPAPVLSGVQYQIILEETVRTTDGNTVVDEPLTFNLMVRHPRSGNITDAILNQAFRRFVGAVLIPAHDLSDTVLDPKDGNSSSRFLDLARFAELPVRENMGSAAADS